jgi:hypothetical protein
LIGVVVVIITGVRTQLPPVTIRICSAINPQSPEMGSTSHWALIAYVTVGTRKIKEQRSTARTSVFIDVISGVCRCTFMRIRGVCQEHILHQRFLA